MRYFTKTNGENFDSEDLTVFNKTAIFSNNKPEFIKIIHGKNIYVMDYILGELRVNGAIIHKVEKEFISILRPINFRRHSVIPTNKKLKDIILFNGLGYQYTSGKNHKCFIVVSDVDDTFSVVEE